MRVPAFIGEVTHPASLPFARATVLGSARRRVPGPGRVFSRLTAMHATGQPYPRERSAAAARSARKDAAGPGRLELGSGPLARFPVMGQAFAAGPGRINSGWITHS